MINVSNILKILIAILFLVTTFTFIPQTKNTISIQEFNKFPPFLRSEQNEVLKDPHKKPVIKIMPLGDSITRGLVRDIEDEYHGGYRKYLAEILTSNGYSFEFVGYQSDDPVKNIFRYEGGNGYVIGGNDVSSPDQIYQNVQRSLDTWKPDVILLLIGTNDLLINDNESVEFASIRFEKLVEKILTTSPSVKLAIGSLPPFREHITSNSKNRESFNESVNNIISIQNIKGYDIKLADFGAKIHSEDLGADAIHFNEQGYKKMAEIWYEAITSSESR